MSVVQQIVEEAKQAGERRAISVDADPSQIYGFWDACTPCARLERTCFRTPSSTALTVVRSR